MKSTIEGFNQEYATELKKEVVNKNGKKVTIQIDFTDLVILRWFVDVYPTMKKIIIDEKEYAWVDHGKIKQDMPLLNVTKRYYIERMKKLVEFGILEYHLQKNGGTFSLYAFGENYNNLIMTRSDTVYPQQHTVCPQQHTVCPQQHTVCPQQHTVCPQQHNKSNIYNNNIYNNTTSNYEDTTSKQVDITDNLVDNLVDNSVDNSVDNNKTNNHEDHLRTPIAPAGGGNLTSENEKPDADVESTENTDNDESGNGSVGKSEEKEEPAHITFKASALLSAEQQALFDRFWKAYPKKSGKWQAATTWSKLNPNKAMTDKIIVGVKNYMENSPDYRKGYIQNPSTWLNAAGWEDDYTFVLPDKDKARGYTQTGMLSGVPLYTAINPNTGEKIETTNMAYASLVGDGGLERLANKVDNVTVPIQPEWEPWKKDFIKWLTNKINLTERTQLPTITDIIAVIVAKKGSEYVRKLDADPDTHLALLKYDQYQQGLLS